MKSERGLGHRLPNQLGTSLPARGSLKGPLWLAGRTERAVTGVSEHALHQKARLVGAAAAAAVVFAGVRAQQTVTAGALQGRRGRARLHPPPPASVRPGGWGSVLGAGSVGKGADSGA